ncbi:hypothetical protein KL950_003519 [Ogataea haglerorum]|nr:hypothetical protein KL950_003519 [Ogataea haglerorum]
MSLDGQDIEDLLHLAGDIGTAHRQVEQSPSMITKQERNDLGQFHQDAKQESEILAQEALTANNINIQESPKVSSTSIWSFLGSCGINLVLPFINGVMLGFGEILAHEIGFRYNWAGAKVEGCRASYLIVRPMTATCISSKLYIMTSLHRYPRFLSSGIFDQITCNSGEVYIKHQERPTDLALLMNRDVASSNKYLLRTSRYLVAQYAKQRNVILRLAYATIIYMIFNGGSSSKGKPSIKYRPEHKNGTIVERLTQRFKSSPLVLLVSQLSYKNEKTRPILGYMILQIGLSLVRAVIALKVAALDGYLVSSLITKRFKTFFKYLLLWTLIGVPAAVTESLLTKTRQLLALAVRRNVTNEVLNIYLPDSGNSTVYHLINKSKHTNLGDSIDDPNHRITTVIEQFSNSLSSIPSQVLTPTMDIALAAHQLSKTGENAAEGGLLLGLITNVSTLVLKIFTPNFSKLIALRNSLENKFHAHHSKVINNSEEIALAKGHRREIDLLDMNYFELERFKRMELRRMAVYDFAVSFIFKYTLGAFGLLLCSLPIFTTAYKLNYRISENASSRISADFITNRRLLLTASDSLGKLVRAKKNIQNLLGYSESIWEFEQVLTEINKSVEEEAKLEAAINNEPLVKGPNVSYGDEISFLHVPLVTPTGTILVEDLTFTIKPGENLLIIGPNGCGKSSLFRILGGLWPVQNPGHLVVPQRRQDLFYLPQKSYLTYGSLREQIVYPDTLEEYQQKLCDARATGSLVRDDVYLMELLRLVKLEKLAEIVSEDEDEEEKHVLSSSNSPLDTVKRWPDLLSVGEQQRLALVRMYYHQPRFAVLDECTSSISPDLEQECYRLAIERFGITVLSVCHRTSLWKFHSHILKFESNKNRDTTDEEDENDFDNGRISISPERSAKVTFSKFDPAKRLARHNELIEIDNMLKNRSNIRKRLQSLDYMRNRNKKILYIQDED